MEISIETKEEIEMLAEGGLVSPRQTWSRRSS